MKVITQFEHLVAIIERCLIAMMTVSDIQLTLSEEVVDKFYLLGMGNRGEKVLFLHLVSNLHLGSGGVRREQPSHAALWIIIHAHQGTEISGARPQQLQ